MTKFRSRDVLTCDKCEHTFTFSEGIVFGGDNIFDEVEEVKICPNCINECGTKAIIEYIDERIEFHLLSVSAYLMGAPMKWRSKLSVPVIST